MANPKRITDLNPTNLQPSDQLLIARLSGLEGENFRVPGSDVLSFNTLNTSTIQLAFNSATRTLQANLATNFSDNINPFGTKSVNTILAAPIDSEGVPEFRLLDSSDIPSLSADKITEGVFDPERIPNISGNKITSGIVGADFVSNLDADKITSGTLNISRIPNLNANKITEGVFDVERIPNLNADKITGVLSTARIPSLNTNKITSGLLPTERGGTGTAITGPNLIFAGPIVGVAQSPNFRELNQLDIPALDASKITTGTLNINIIPNIPVSKIIGTGISLDPSLVPNIDASKITTGQLNVDRLPFTPVQQGGGLNQNNNKIYIGWTNTGLNLQIDATSFGSNWPLNLDASRIATGILSLERIPLQQIVSVLNTSVSSTFDQIFENLQDVVYTTGNQSISGEKTFVSSTRINSLGIGTPASGIQGQLRVAGSIQATGNIQTTGDVIAFSTSDERLKENIKPIENALEKVSKISGVTFDWTEKFLEENSGYPRNDVGVIAQEVQEVFPQIVVERDNGYLAIKYDKICVLLIESIKELKKENNYLKQEIQTIKDLLKIN